METHDNSQFLYLTSKGWKIDIQHRIEIWFVEYDGRYYVMSEHLERADWVKNIIHDPRVLVTVNHDTFDGIARIVDKGKEPQLSAEVSKLMRTKEIDGLIVELKHS